MIRTLLAAAACLAALTPARADWTANVGYHNPYGSTYGLNALYWGQKIGFELGVGWVDVSAETNGNDPDEKKDEDGDGDVDQADEDERKRDAEARLVVAGEADLRYFLASGTVSPYLQGGFGLGFSAKAGEGDSGAGAGTGGGFAGLGLMLGSKSFHGYAALNLDGNQNPFFQAGIGLDI
jgi:hypothetical protein